MYHPNPKGVATSSSMYILGDLALNLAGSYLLLKDMHSFNIFLMLVSHLSQ